MLDAGCWTEGAAWGGGWLACTQRERERERERRGGHTAGRHNNPSPAAPHCAALHCTALHCFCSVFASSRFCREFARCMPLPWSYARLSPHLSPEPLCLCLPTIVPTHLPIDIAENPIPPSSIFQASPSRPLKAQNTCPPSPACLIGRRYLSRPYPVHVLASMRTWGTSLLALAVHPQRCRSLSLCSVQKFRHPVVSSQHPVNKQGEKTVSCTTCLGACSPDPPTTRQNCPRRSCRPPSPARPSSAHTAYTHIVLELRLQTASVL
jgi:hypothetical protein